VEVEAGISVAGISVLVGTSTAISEGEMVASGGRGVVFVAGDADKSHAEAIRTKRERNKRNFFIVEILVDRFQFNKNTFSMHWTA
jgi:hypothetical protein